MYVYVMYNKDNQVLYVGQTKNMKYRMTQHFGSQAEEWKKEVDKIKYMNCFNEVDMNIYEIYLISKLKPKYNKSFVFDTETILNLPYSLKEYFFFNNTSLNDDDITTKEEKDKFKKLIVLYKDKGKSRMNTNYDNKAKENVTPFHKGEHLLSYSWYDKNRVGRTRIFKNTYNFLRTGVAKKISWTGTFSPEDSDDIPESTSYRLNSTKDYNFRDGIDYTKINVLAYIDNNIVYDESGSVNKYLSIVPLITFLKRSSLEVNEEIHLYLPSLRMRELLKEYLEGNIKPNK